VTRENATRTGTAAAVFSTAVVVFQNEAPAKGADLYLHQQRLDTNTQGFRRALARLGLAGGRCPTLQYRGRTVNLTALTH
jgi:hypothetical protein